MGSQGVDALRQEVSSAYAAADFAGTRQWLSLPGAFTLDVICGSHV
jgi:hypothetical protein